MVHIGLSRQEMRRIESLIEHLDGVPPTGVVERRLRPRIDFCHPMWLSLPVAPGQPWVRVHSRNLSTGGLAFVARQGFALGSYVVISHHLNEGEDQLALCVVKSCRPVETGLYEVGVEFQAVVPDSEGQRRIPAAWSSLVFQHLWIVRSSPTGELSPNVP